MKTRPVVFLDDGGVISENAQRGGQWERLVGEFFAPRLGGEPASWAEANRVVATALFEDFDAVLGADPAYAPFQHRYNRLWLPPMCARVGVPAPPDGQVDDLFWEAISWITPRVKADVDGAADAVRWLRANDYRLFTASGEDSISLNGYLSAIGIRDCFGERLFGPDLLGVVKSGDWFYERLFAESGVAPTDALVIDDSAKAVGWARQVGARALHVGTELGGLRDLPAWLLARPEG